MHSFLARRALVVFLALLAAAPALAADGHFDPDFGTNGVLTVAWDLGGAKNDHLADVVSDGTALFAVGYGSSLTGDDDWEIARVEEDGGTITKASTFFDLGGGKSDHALAAALDGDYLVVAGTAEAGTYNAIEVCRYARSDVFPDFGFGDVGCAGYDEGSGVLFQVTGVAVAADGGYVVGGNIYQSGNRGFFALKITSGGSVDTTFGSSGIRVEQWDEITNGDDFVAGMTIARDGGILLAGGVEVSSGDHEPAMAKVTPGGNVDTSFGSAGLALFPTSFNCWFAGVDSHPVDTWLDVGDYCPGLPPGKGGAIAFELDAGGSVGPHAATVGWDTFDANVITRIRYEGDGKTFVAGYVDDPTDGAVLAATRLLSAHDGVIDTNGWGINGVRTWSPYGAGYGHGAAPVSTALWGGRLVLGASVDGAGNEDWLLVRFTNAFTFYDGFETGDAKEWNARTP